MDISLMSYFILLPIYALTAVVLLVFTFFRCIVGILIRIKCGKKINFLNGIDSFYQMLHGKNKAYVQFACKMPGKIDLNWIQNRVFNSLNSDHKNYWRFFNYVEYFCGYFYWQQEVNFNIEEHVFQLNCDPPSTEKELEQLLSKLINENCDEANKSPWKMHVFPLAKNFQNFSSRPYYVIQIIFDHSLSDALGYVKFFFKTFYEQKSLNIASETNKATHKNTLQQFRQHFNTALHIPASFWRQIRIKDNNILCGLSQIGDQVLSSSSPVQLDRIKAIRKATKCTINDIMLSCLGGAIKKYLQKRNVEFPKNLHCAIPVSLRKQHNLVLGNELSMIIFEFTNDSQSPLNRLKSTAKQMTFLKNSYDKNVTLLFSKLFNNRIPNIFIQQAIRFTWISVYLTNIAYPTTPSRNGKFNWFTLYPPLGKNIGLAFAVQSHNDHIFYTASSDKSIISSDEILHQILMDCINEIDELERDISTMGN